jgi:hypothetical protein
VRCETGKECLNICFMRLLLQNVSRYVVSCRVTLTLVCIPSETGINFCEKRGEKNVPFPLLLFTVVAKLQFC